MNPWTVCVDCCDHQNGISALNAMSNSEYDINAATITSTPALVVPDQEWKKAPVSLSSIYVGSIPCGTKFQEGCEKYVEEPAVINVEMTLGDFQQFLEGSYTWYGTKAISDTEERDSSSTAVDQTEPHYLEQQYSTSDNTGRNRSSNIWLFDPCSSLGAEVTLCDFLVRNHDNINVRVHENIYSEEIQISDSRRSAVMVMMDQHPVGDIFVDSDSSNGVEVQPIHTFDDILPPNLMNASFDETMVDDNDDVTADMNESYTEMPFDDIDEDNFCGGEGRWIRSDTPLFDTTATELTVSSETNSGSFVPMVDTMDDDALNPVLPRSEDEDSDEYLRHSSNSVIRDESTVQPTEGKECMVLSHSRPETFDCTPVQSLNSEMISTSIAAETDVADVWEGMQVAVVSDYMVPSDKHIDETSNGSSNRSNDDDENSHTRLKLVYMLLFLVAQIIILYLSFQFRVPTATEITA